MFNLQSSQKLYDELIQHQNDLNNRTKMINEIDKLKEIETELNYINNLMKILLKTMNYYKRSNQKIRKDN